MKFSISSLVLSTFALGASAATMHHGKAHNHAMRHSEQIRTQNEAREMSKRTNLSVLSALSSNKLASLKISTVGNQPVASIGGTAPWVGTGGDVVNQVYCQGSLDCTLVVWGPSGSWVASVVPQLVVSIPQNTSQSISFPNGWSGAFAPVYSDTVMSEWGQIFETWGEGTVNYPYTTFDVSREVNMGGRNMRIVLPTCTTDMVQCSFHCTNGQNSCGEFGTYDLVNCSTEQQAGANKGSYGGAASGGCSGLKQTGNVIQTYLNYAS